MEEKKNATPVAQPAEFQLLYQAIGNCAAPAVQQMVLADPKWLHHKSRRNVLILYNKVNGSLQFIFYNVYISFFNLN